MAVWKSRGQQKDQLEQSMTHVVRHKEDHRHRSQDTLEAGALVTRKEPRSRPIGHIRSAKVHPLKTTEILKCKKLNIKFTVHMLNGLKPVLLWPIYTWVSGDTR